MRRQPGSTKLPGHGPNPSCCTLRAYRRAEEMLHEDGGRAGKPTQG
jgi:hypothetical protein